MRYRPEIDGLRAIAVIAVILFHAGVPLITGGFLGVDVFFVISGFVIGAMLMAELADGTFSLAGFYARRVRRLGPALVTVTLCTLLASAFLLLPWELSKLGDSVLSVYGIYANRYFLRATDYFSPNAELLPMLHTWSLSIEEQFYLVLPLLLVVARWIRMPGKLVIAALALLLFVSFGVAVFFPYNLAGSRFYNTETRIWELLAGVILARGQRYLPKMRIASGNVISLVGLAMILASLFLIDRTARVPGVLSLLPVVGTMLVIATAQQGQVAYKFLANPIAVAIGAGSYSAYLWHQPVLALARKALGNSDLSGFTLLLLFAFIAVLTVLTYRFIEQPFRNRALMPARFAVGSVACAVALMAGSAFALQQTHGFKKIYLSQLSPENAARVGALDEAIQSRQPTAMMDDGLCHIWQTKIDGALEKRFADCVGKHGAALVVLGDSHAMDLFNAFAAASGRPFVVGVSRGACGPARFSDKVCPYGKFLEFAAKNKTSIARVYLMQSGKFFANNGALDETAVGSAAGFLKQLSADVPSVWMGPHYQPDVNLDVLNPFVPFEGQFTAQSAVEITALDDVMAKRAAAAGLNYVSLVKATHVDPAHDLIIDGQFTYSDEDHWSSAGERVFGARLMQVLDLK
jgi:peptidoglycan/LPS O-acetylase OafA/YrhL